MTDYTTRTLAEAVIGADEVEANAKSATRTLRKFLRAEAVEAGGKVGTDTPGKGGRYSITLTKPQVKAMTKRFVAWQEAEAKAAAARLAAREVATSEAEVTSDEVIEDDTDNEAETVEGPTDEEIAAIIAGDDNTDDEV